MTSAIVASTDCPQLLGVVLDPAGLREVLRELLGGAGATRRSASTSRQVVPVVPWSMARMRSDAARRYHAGVRAFAGRLAAVEEGACRGDRVADHGDVGDAVATDRGANEVVW
jgi:hypothetical protein